MSTFKNIYNYAYNNNLTHLDLNSLLASVRGKNESFPSELEIIAFPVKDVTDPFPVLSRCHKPIDWSIKNSQELSETLNCQIKDNWADFVQLASLCTNPKVRENLLYTLSWDPITRSYSKVNNFYQSEEQKIEQCKLYGKRLKGYKDVFNRDTNVFNQENWTVTTYAIVVLYKGQYFGHIYAWISPLYPLMCLAMGIRGRVDSVFQKDTLQNTSNYLLEGVRRFAIAKGCYWMTITKPLPVMVNILSKLGFEKSFVKVAGIGISLTYPYENAIKIDCNDCYQIAAEKHGPFTGTTPVTFDLVE